MTKKQKIEQAAKHAYRVELHLSAPGRGYCTRKHPAFPLAMASQQAIEDAEADALRFAREYGVPAVLGLGYGSETGTKLSEASA